MTPDVFAYDNQSATTRLQQNLLSKLATLTGIKPKMLKPGIDKERSEKYGVLALGNTDCPIKEEFYIADCSKLKPEHFMTQKAFEKSQFYEQKTLMNAVPERQGARFVAYIAEPAPSYWVQASIHEMQGSDVGGGGIYMNYPGFKDEMLVPLELYVKVRYPSPSQE